eukprot:365424-Chlamydomonas_euryale.AAC.10
MEGLLPPPGRGAAAYGAAAAAARAPASADLHGCDAMVVACGDVRHAGAAGIVAAVTARAVALVCPDDTLHVVPKAGSVFVFEVPGTGQVVQLDTQSWLPRRG